MFVSRVVGSKGQVVVPQSIRKQAGFSPGTAVVFDIEGDRVTMRRKDASNALDAFFGSIPAGNKLRSTAEIKRAIEAQYDD
ncbi:hypothetical protein AUJ14_06145 [Candidatus Micrarchaeota archaeon CG1_02_55_22]|nr:MAG: hypothetical protein AUJ14_06145 [Candidatus Micrarchaeota archaeon CG1_02_55_22]